MVYLQYPMFDETVPTATNVASLQQWPPSLKEVKPDWLPVLTEFFESEAGKRLNNKIINALEQGCIIYPPDPLRAFKLLALKDVKVVILGQDPYHTPGMADGLAFSASKSKKVPPSLRNILKELDRDLGGERLKEQKTDLSSWLEQGVLLINAVFTVEQGKPGSHADWGWQDLSDELIKLLAKSKEYKIFMLWGAFAQQKGSIITLVDLSERHLCLKANHPSPLSAAKGTNPFVNCSHFSKANTFLKTNYKLTVNW